MKNLLYFCEKFLIMIHSKRIIFQEGSKIVTETSCTMFKPIFSTYSHYEIAYSHKKIKLGAKCENCIIHDNKLICLYTCLPCTGERKYFRPAIQTELNLF